MKYKPDTDFYYGSLGFAITHRWWERDVAELFRRANIREQHVIRVMYKYNIDEGIKRYSANRIRSVIAFLKTQRSRGSYYFCIDDTEMIDGDQFLRTLKE